MSIAFSPTPPAALRVEIKPSNYFSAMLIGVALVALGAIFYAELSWPLRTLLTIVALIYSISVWRQQRRQHGLLQWRSSWYWRGVDGVERALRLQHSTAWPGLIVLTFNDIERKQKFVLTLLRDSFSDSGFFCSNIQSHDERRLRVHLNHFPVFENNEKD